MKFVKNNALSILITLAVCMFGLFHLNDLSEQVATHFNIHGQADSYSSKMMSIFLLPSITMIMIFGLAWLTPMLIRTSPKGFTLENSEGVLSKINLVFALFLNGIQMGVLEMNLNPGKYSMGTVVCVFFALLMIGFGNFMSKLERNFFVGIRTPWTITSDKNWLATHRFAAKLMVCTGIFLLILTKFTESVFVAAILSLVSFIIPVGYSFWYYRKYERGNETSQA